MNVVPSRPEVRRSLAEGLLVCPQFQREDGEALAFGSAVHAFIASYWRHLQAVRRDSDLTQVTGLASAAWARTAGLDLSRHDEFMALCGRFADTHLGLVETIVAVEETLVHDAGFAILNCTPDRIDRLAPADQDEEPTWLLIHDYKTEQGEMEHGFQMRWYVKQAELQYPSAQRIDFEIDPIRARSGPYERVTFERGELDQWWETTQAGLRQRLAAPHAPPVGGPACRDCALRFRCARSIVPVFAEPRTEEQADQLLADWHRLDAGAAARWEALRLWYQDREPRVVNGEEIGFLETREPSFRWTAMPSAVAAWARRRGMDWRAFADLATKTTRNKGVQDLAVADGVAELAFNPPVFKTRNAPTERRKRRAAAGEGS